MAMRNQPWQADGIFKQSVSANIEGVVKRAESMACKLEREQVNIAEYIQLLLLMPIHPGG